MEKTAVFAGGCFWCITPFFEELDGVLLVRCGYSGGTEVNPSYEDVKAQRTGHREAVRITYDDGKASYSELLDVFLSHTDPFDGEGQFIDRGHSYTLAVFYNDEYERSLAEKKIEETGNKAGKKTFVALQKYSTFFEAEEYHQDYYLKNPEAFYQEMVLSCRIPKKQ